ncbi:hypothetical protein PLESTB_001563700 [Pleodorina starrii]|uniref:Uncharacterized protein n=1 Tax=Pleodorina starrii TaxID=330485 RepID=A0A9W6F8A1_9CHLO|nr:hypothetical protein PLESTM_001479500 [Pleodorina starrii]GLC60013.1 hypothetical protein PLESTB_001563700 [Pleodorina starrii]GLC72760.1 hypothetical protein PLESTF_001290400 [Pleodorina starrii]
MILGHTAIYPNNIWDGNSRRRRSQGAELCCKAAAAAAPEGAAVVAGAAPGGACGGHSDVTGVDAALRSSRWCAAGRDWLGGLSATDPRPSGCGQQPYRYGASEDGSGGGGSNSDFWR